MIELLGSTFIASLVGSLHCLGMCGPIASLATASPGRTRLPVFSPKPPSWRSATGAAASYNVGRLASYLGLGLLAGGAGFLLDAGGTLVGLARITTLVAGSALLLGGILGLLVAAGLRLPRPLRLSGSSLVARLAARLPRNRPGLRASLLGVLTGCMPCGWLWAFVLAAASTGSPWKGALVMLAFWAGTLPSLMIVGLGAHHLTGRVRAALPWILPVMLMLVGAVTLATRWGVPSPPAPPTPDATGVTPAVPSLEDAPCH